MKKEFFNENIMRAALKNNFFRKVLATNKNSQLVLMSLNPWEDIGMEIHKKYDQIVVNVSGEGESNIDGEKRKFMSGTLAYVPKGTWHNFLNIGKNKLKLYTIYAPANHPPKTVHKTKKDAEKAELKEKD